MRILMWNIQFFTNNRITAQPGTTQQETLANQQSAQANLDFITSTIVEADADIFVVLETLSSQGEIGTLASGGGPDGLLTILAALRQIDANWCLVPPLRCNPQEILNGHTYTESVGVFWRNDRLQFTGPWYWTGGNGPSHPLPNNAATYNAPWDACVPPNMNRAACCRYFRQNYEEIFFPDQVNRRPYLTTFQDLNGRRLKLFSVHTKPGTAAQTATARMTGIYMPSIVPGQNEVSVFAGDFNLNLIGLNTVQSAAVQLFALSNFNLPNMFQPNNALPPSRYLPRNSSAPNGYLTDQLFDYAFVRYGQGAQPNQPLPQVVIDRVPGVASPNGLPQFSTHMNQSLANINNVQTTTNISQGGAVRQQVNDRMVTAFATADPHGLVPMDWVQVANVQNNTFNDHYQVIAELSTHSFLAIGTNQNVQPAHSGGGTVTAIFRLENIFRQMANFGHIGPPAYRIGTSDHLPIFLIV